MKFQFPKWAAMILRVMLWLAILSSTLGFREPVVSSAAGPLIENVQVLTPTLARFDRFEARFDLRTAASNLSLPYDPASPKGLEHISGVSADALFTSPSGRSITYPAFYYQPYQITQVDGQDHRLPAGKAYWLVRFTPQEEGSWQLRLRATDANGTTLFPQDAPLAFMVSGTSQNIYRSRGFLHPSQRDPRYFEFQDGTTFIGTGFNVGFDDLAKADQSMGEMEKNRINFIRAWLSTGGINGSQWTPWASVYLSYDGYLPAVSFETADTYAGHDLAWKLDDRNPCLFQGWQGGRIAVEPDAAYTLWVRAKVSGVSAAGFVVKTGGWLDRQCTQADRGSAVTKPLSGTTGWTELTGTIRTQPGQSWLDYLYMARQGAGGIALVDEIRLYRTDDPSQTNILRQPSPNSHLSFDPSASADWDVLIDSAGQHGVYLKLVVDEKNEWIRNHINADGSFVDQGSNDNFYSKPGTKVRWLEQAWWRYLVARWGYSTAIHSFEYVNEGDPYDGNHYDAANAMAVYIHQNDPARHMVTTSLWHSFPGPEFWNNPQYSEIDYADLHAYLSTGWPDGKAVFLNKFPLDTTAANMHSAPASARIEALVSGSDTITPRGLSLREKGEWTIRYWMKTDHFTTNCPYNGSGSMVGVRWAIDNGPANGGTAGIVPTNQAGQDYVCASPAGSFDWRQFRSDRDRDGNPVPAQYRLVIADDKPHEIALWISNQNGASGTAWISDVELVSPSGKIVPVIGQLDPTSMQADTAWYNASYGLLLGGGSPVGAHKPLVLGEVGLDSSGQTGYLKDLNKDQQGIWLHNNLWAQLGPGGTPDLFWWSNETISQNSQTGRTPGLYPLYLSFQNFMDGIPLSNGQYRDAQAQTSNPLLRAWGQRNDANGQAFLWIQNRAHTWQAAVEGSAISPLSGQVTLLEMPPGTYRITWWDTYNPANPILKTETASPSGGALTLVLPAPLTADIAVKIARQCFFSPAIYPFVDIKCN